MNILDLGDMNIREHSTEQVYVEIVLQYIIIRVLVLRYLSMTI